MTTEKSAPVSAPSFSLDDVYFTVFRHKWKILLFTLVGFVAAAVVYTTAEKPFTSVASLLVRYVQEGKGPTSAEGNDNYKSPEARGGESIIAAEIAIILSNDLALQVAETVGPEKILAAYGGGNDRGAAAGRVRAGLAATAPRRGTVITLTYSHLDGTVAPVVLTAIIEAYLKRHVEIHRPAGTFDDFLTQQTDQLRARLAQTEDELRKARAKAGIISLEDTRRAQSETINSLKRQLLDAERSLAERSARLAEMLKMYSQPTPAPTPSKTEVAPSKPDVRVPAEDYRNLVELLAQLKVRERELLQQFTPENNRVKVLRAQITETELARENLETRFPSLRGTAQTILVPETSTTLGPTFDFKQAYGEIAGLESNVRTLGTQLAQVRAEAADLDSLESSIQELERRKTIEESNYRNFSANLERTRMEESLGAGRVTNISRIQNPSPAFRDASQIKKIALGIGAGGLALGLGLAFAIELLFDRTIRRVSQIEKNLGLDVFISIPAVSQAPVKPSDGTGSDALALRPDTLPPWEPANALHAYYTALRDRTISFFDSRNLNHKPRLVALTGLGRDQGAAQIAAGLAGCLSETGEGKVLFVDMTSTQGAAQQFYNGESVESIDEALKESADSKARMNENLYVAGSEGAQGDKLPMILPKRFSHLIPKLRASDFDYIIFNLPPVSNLSVTPRLAQHMDVVLMVMESEKTETASVEKAKAMLGNSKAHVAAILNKTKQYVPRRLVKEIT